MEFTNLDLILAMLVLFASTGACSMWLAARYYAKRSRRLTEAFAKFMRENGYGESAIYAVLADPAPRCKSCGKPKGGVRG